MKAEHLTILGFDIVAGQVDYQGKNYGFLTPTGAVLTPEGEALVAERMAGRVDPSAPATHAVPTAATAPVAGKGKAKGKAPAAATHPVPVVDTAPAAAPAAAPADPTGDLLDGLDGLMSGNEE